MNEPTKCIHTWLEALDGNTNDKSSFPQTVKAYQKQLRGAEETYFVADSALYTKKSLQDLSAALWVTRVPLTIAQAQKLLISCDEDEVQEWLVGYWGREYEVTYGDVEQRWLVVFSQTAYERESKTFARQLEKAKAKAEAALDKVCKRTFSCCPDAEQVVSKIATKWRYHQPQVEIEPILGYDEPGRPAKGGQPTVKGYKVVGNVIVNDKILEQLEKRRGKFIITIPNQVGKPTQTPTMRCVFQMFEGVDLLFVIFAGQVIDRQVLNLRPVLEQIVTLP